MCIRIGFICMCITQLLLNRSLTGAVYQDCPVRQSLIAPGRVCQKPCVRNIDCTSRKKICLCDMNCGMSCIKKKHRCFALPNIPNGFVIHPRMLSFGSSAKYECNAGYRLDGTKVRACQGDKTWSGIEPKCVYDASDKSECSVPPVVPNAVHDGPPNQVSFPIHSTLEYECLPGYTMDRDAVQKAWCVTKGGWVGPDLTCIHTGCPSLKDIENGMVEQAPAVNIGGYAIYRCQVGFHLAGREKRKCGPNGRWEGVEPSCEKAICGRPPYVENAVHNGDHTLTRFPSGAQLLYTCIDGFYADGLSRAMCTGERWEGLTLSCKALGCGFPGNITNGWRSGFTFTYPHSVYYHCNEGYDLIGPDYRQCQDNGAWSNSVPQCIPVACPTLFHPAFGDMLGSGHTFDTVLRFECRKGYQLLGSDERRCRRDRTWTGTAPKCEEIHCPLPVFYNGLLIGKSTSFGATMYYRCSPKTKNKNYVYRADCLESGKWSALPPVCLGQCQVPRLENATILRKREGEWVDHNGEVEFRCGNGMVSSHMSVMKCNNGTWTSSPDCIAAPCQRPPPHVHRGMRVYFGTRHMDKAKYKCFPGYRLDHTKMSTPYLTCTFGEWLGGKPQCEEFYCKSPERIDHGEVYKTFEDVKFIFKEYIKTIEHGTRLEYKCNDGYRLDGPSGATCVNGDWRPALGDPHTKCKVATHPPVLKLWHPITDEYGDYDRR